MASNDLPRFKPDQPPAPSGAPPGPSAYPASGQSVRPTTGQPIPPTSVQPVQPTQPAQPPQPAQPVPPRRRTAGPSRPLDATPRRARTPSGTPATPAAAPAPAAPQMPPWATAAPPPYQPQAQPYAAAGYAAQPGYPAQPAAGYPAQPAAGYPAQTPQPAYAGYQGPPPTPPAPPRPPTAPKRRHPVRRFFVTLAILLVLAIAYPVGLGLWANGQINRLDVISTTVDTPGRTYLIAGSDQRGSGGVNDATEGARTDTIMLLHVAQNGRAYLVSIPRDTYVQIPGYSPNKINAAYAFGGPELLIQTVEQLTSMHIDHYVEVGFGSVTDLVDAVGGVELCLDMDVDDQKSHLKWTAGCHQADGTTALAFSRMRYSDPEGDIGRASRQRQVVSAVMKKAITPKNLLWPPTQIDLIKAGTGALAVDKDMNAVALARMLLDFRAATGPDGVTGTPTIASLDYEPGGIGSAVLLDADQSEKDFRAIENGTWEGNPTD